MALRIGLFIATNLAVMFVLNLILTLTGVNQPGSNVSTFVILAGVVGVGGSFISLLMSKTIAKRGAGARVIDQPGSDTEEWLTRTVQRLAADAEIGLPEVAVFNSPTPNAFATGASKDNALVAVSAGLLNNMTSDEVEAVLAHEISHIKNGDMVTLSLIQGVLNTFVMVAAYMASALLDRGNGRQGVGFSITYMVTQTIFGFLATLIVRWFSRWREYRADAGGASLAGNQKMIAALDHLRRLQRPVMLPDQLQAFGINGGLLQQVGLKKLLLTHPPLEDRIAALQTNSNVELSSSKEINA